MSIESLIEDGLIARRSANYENTYSKETAEDIVELAEHFINLR